MKKFRFRLDPLLKLKRDREEELGNQLAELLQQLASANRDIVAHEADVQEFYIAFGEMKKQGVSASELQWGSRSFEYFRNRKTRLLERKRLVEEKIEAKKRELAHAMKERKIMEKLKEHAFRSYVEEFEKAEQRAIEEIVTYRGSLKREDL